MVRRPRPSDHNKVGEGARDTKEERSALTREGARGPEFGWGDGESQALTPMDSVGAGIQCEGLDISFQGA